MKNGKNRAIIIALLLMGALVAFELFNFSTTEVALESLLGNSIFFGFRISVLLSVAFCGVDFAGLLRAFTPEQGKNEPKEVMFLLSAWGVAVVMNASLTWWYCVLSLSENISRTANLIVDQNSVLLYAPIVVSLTVLVSRLLIIGTVSFTLDRNIFQSMNKKIATPTNRRKGNNSHRPRNPNTKQQQKTRHSQ